jgi:hypothetical protein
VNTNPKAVGYIDQADVDASVKVVLTLMTATLIPVERAGRFGRSLTQSLTWKRPGLR